MKQRWLLLLVGLALVVGVIGFAPAGVTRATPNACLNDTNTQFRSIVSGNWNATSTWECSDDGTTWQSATGAPTSANGAITIRSPHVVTVTATVTVDQVTVDAGAQVTVNSTFGWTLANGAGTDLAINGTVVNSGLTLFSSAGPTWVVNDGGTYIHNTTSGIATPLGGATFTTNSNFIYRGSSTLNAAVSISGRTFGNFSFESTSGIWTPTMSGGVALTINGNYTIGTNVVFNGSASFTGAINVKGNWTNNGTYTTGTNTVTFNGASIQAISGTSATTFNNLTIANGITLSTNATVNGLLTLNADLTTSANILTLGPSAIVSGSGDVIGTVRRTSPATGSALTFNNAQTTLNFTTAPTQMDVTLIKSAPGTFTFALPRQYALTPTGSVNATVQLAYKPAEVPGGTTESNIVLWRDNAGTWVNQHGTVDTSNATWHWVSLPGVTQFSNWTLSGLTPNAITLTTFSGRTPANDGWIVLILLAAAGLLVGGWILQRRFQQ